MAASLVARVPSALKRLAASQRSPLAPRIPPAATQSLLWAVEALARAVAFGPEDALHGGGVGGGVRAALPAALSSLLALQLSLEQLCAVSRLDRASGRGGHQRGLPEHDALAACLDASLALLVREAGAVLPALSFPPAYAARLQRYVNLALG